MDTYILVKEVIDEWDPIGLLGLGCPDDEYDSEITDIVRLLSDVNSVEELAARIQEVFVKWFEEEFPIEICFRVALKILNSSNG